MSDLVSIIMPSYNTAQYITETIQSVIDQTCSLVNTIRNMTFGLYKKKRYVKKNRK